MEFARQSRRQFYLPRFAIHIHLPLYLWLMFSLLLGIVILIYCAMLLNQLAQPPNPLSAYRDLFRSDRAFNCHEDVFPGSDTFIERYSTLGGYRECTYLLDDGPFSEIVVTSHTINFTVRDNMLTVGDLSRFWGKPEMLYSASSTAVSFYWPEMDAIAHTRSMNSRFSYFSPIRRVFVADLDP